MGDLTTVPGLGPARRATLLRHFGSVRKIAGATEEQIAEVPGIGPRLASAVLAALAPGQGTGEISDRGGAVRHTVQGRDPLVNWRWGQESALDGPVTEIVIVTGMSGAGRSTTAKSLEDLDWFVIDNLPPGLLPTMIDLAMRANGALPRIAAVMDVRSRAFTTNLQASIRELSSRGIRPRVVFLEASDETLVRRFENSRQASPAARGWPGGGRDRCRTDELLRGVREEADLVLDTSALNVHELRARMRDFFGTGAPATLRASVVSFGYKYGLPVDADLVADCRCSPATRAGSRNWPALTGQDERVREYVLKQPGATEWLDSYLASLRIIFDGYPHQGKQYVTLAIGCTGGKHRSVVMAEEIAGQLEQAGLGVQVVHRDLGRE